MNRRRSAGEPFDHRPPRWIRQSRKCCVQMIHNHMVVYCAPMSTLSFGSSRLFLPAARMPLRDRGAITRQSFDVLAARHPVTSIGEISTIVRRSTHAAGARPRIRVTAAENTHYALMPPEDRKLLKSFSYRIETPHGAIVFTGDTAPSDAVARLAKGADQLGNRHIREFEPLASPFSPTCCLGRRYGCNPSLRAGPFETGAEGGS